jgi:glycosyltransferase involved in cell wall biosynthesis
MRIGFFHPHFQAVGGAENLIVSQTSYLHAQGHAIRVVSQIRDHARWDRVFQDLEVREFSAYPWYELYRSKLSRLERALPRAAAALAGCDAVIAHNFPSCALLGGAPMRSVTRVWYCNEPHRALHMQEANPVSYARSQLVAPASYAERNFASKLRRYHRAMQRASEKRQLRDLDRKYTGQIEIICANSEYTRDNVRRVYGRSDAQVVYPIVRFPARGRSRSGLDRSRGLQILAHARLDAIKNQEHVLRGFALYRARARDAQLHVVGVGDEGRRLRRLALRLGLGRSVRFHGFLPGAELERVYDACDVFALTPLDEPFGMVFPEAAARGLLLVGPSHGGPNEILDGGRLGWTCDPFAPESLAESFERIVASTDAELDARRSKLEESCRNRFSEAVIGPQLERIVLGTHARSFASA